MAEHSTRVQLPTRAESTQTRPGSSSARRPPQLHPPPAEQRTRTSFLVSLFVGLAWLVSVVLASTALHDGEGWWSVPQVVTRGAAAAATWVAVVVLSRRCGGRLLVIGAFAVVPLLLVVGFPEPWALAGAAVVAATAHALLAMVLTRPASGVGALRELGVSALLGVAGAIVVVAYDVELRPFRFRALVLSAVLIAGLLLAWRFGHGRPSLGRRGVTLIALSMVILAGSVAYLQAIAIWGSPEVDGGLDDFKSWVSELLGAAPRPIEAFVGFPALVWGVAIRSQRRQGWWMCAFGALGAAGVTTALVQPATPLSDSIQSSVYGLAIGASVGLALVRLDDWLGSQRHRPVPSTTSAESGEWPRPEPSRFASLL